MFERPHFGVNSRRNYEYRDHPEIISVLIYSWLHAITKNALRIFFIFQMNSYADCMISWLLHVISIFIKNISVLILFQDDS